jgi:uncharacterized protein (TIGR02452 family)
VIRRLVASTRYGVLAIAAQHEHRALALVAWGGGVFRNDSQEIAELFQQALTDRFTGAFAHVRFAVLDSSTDEKFIGPFKTVFAR